MDFQLNRWVAYAGESLVADIRSVSERLGTLDEWKRAFVELHDRALGEGRTLAAALHLRSAEFFMTAADPRKAAARREVVALLRAAYGIDAPFSVPYAGAALPVYRFTPTRPRDTVVIFGGFDSYIEEFFALFLALRDDGLDVIAFEGPGQGSVLEDFGVPMTPDWHRPVAAVLDALGLDGVTLIGISLGGCLAVRAAAFEPRVHRVVAFDVLADFRECVLAQFPSARRGVVRALFGLHANRVLDALARRDHRPIAEWGLAQGMHVFGVATPHDFFREAGRYVTRDVSPRVWQDVLLCAGAEDHYVPLRQLEDQAATLTGARSVTSRVFTRAESGQSHCQIGNLPLALRTIAQWIDSSKRRDPTAKAPRLHRRADIMRYLVGVTIVACLVLGAPPPTFAGNAQPSAIQWSRDKKEPRWVSGFTVVDTPPAAVWTTLRRVPSWPTTFSDIKTMKVKRHDGEAWRLEMSTVTFDCGSHEYEVLLASERTVGIRILAPGVEAVAYVRVRPGPNAEQSTIHYDLYVDAKGVMGWFVSEKTLREKQEAMTVRYLNDLHRAFTRDSQGTTQ